MSTETKPATPAAEMPDGPTSGVRTVISLVLFIHLFCVFVALCANYAPSGLQSRFLRIVRVYCRVFNFDLNQVPYQLTHGEPIDSDHLIEILPQGAAANDPTAWQALPGPMFRGGERFKRYERLGELIDASREFTGDEQSRLAKAVAEYSLHQREIRPKQLRCREHLPVPLEVMLAGGTPAERDPLNAAHFNVVYDAEIQIDEQTRDVTLNKIEAAGQVARPTKSP